MPTNAQPKKRAKRRTAKQWRTIVRRWQRKQLAEVNVPVLSDD